MRTAKAHNISGKDMSRPPRNLDEPSNEELGIVPYTGWRLRLRQLAALLLPYALLALGYGAYLAIAGRAGWL